MSKSFIVSNPRLEKTKLVNPFSYHDAEHLYTTKFSDEQLRNEMIELNGYNHVNLKNMLEYVHDEARETTLGNFLSFDSVYPVVAWNMIKIDDQVEEEEQIATTSHKKYFKDSTKTPQNNNKQIPKVIDMSCTRLDSKVSASITQQLEKDTKELIMTGDYKSPYELNEGMQVVNINIEKGESFVMFTDDNNERDRIIKRDFRFLRMPSNIKIPITGFLVMNTNEDGQYEEINLNNYNLGEDEKKKLFEISNTYFSITSDMSIEKVIKTIFPRQYPVKFEDELDASAVDLDAYKSTKEECSNITTFSCGREATATKRSEMGVVKEIEDSEKVRRNNAQVPDQANSGAPSLPDDFFFTRDGKFDKQFKKVKSKFQAWEEKKCNESDETGNNDEVTGLSNMAMKIYFKRAHKLKYNTELSGFDVGENRSTVNEDYTAEYNLRSFVDTAIEQEQKVTKAIEQFRALRPSDPSEEKIIAIIKSVGFQASVNTQSMYATFDQISKANEDDKRKQYFSAATLIIYSQLEDKPFIVSKPELKSLYVHKSWPVFTNQEPKFKDDKCSSILYVSNVLHNLWKDSPEEIIYDNLRKSVAIMLKILKNNPDFALLFERFAATRDITSSGRDDENDLHLYEGRPSGRRSPALHTSIKLSSLKINSVPYTETIELLKKAMANGKKEFGPKYIQNVNKRGESEYKQVLRENDIEDIDLVDGISIQEQLINEILGKIEGAIGGGEINDLTEAVKNLLDTPRKPEEDVKFVEMNLHKDLYKSKSSDYATDMLTLIKKYQFKSETLLSMKTSSKFKKELKLYCILVQLSKLLSEEKANAAFKKSYIEYISKSFR